MEVSQPPQTHRSQQVPLLAEGSVWGIRGSALLDSSVMISSDVGVKWGAGKVPYLCRAPSTFGTSADAEGYLQCQSVLLARKGPPEVLWSCFGHTGVCGGWAGCPIRYGPIWPHGDISEHTNRIF